MTVAVDCHYCRQIATIDPRYSVGRARHEVNSTAPRCDLHWRYACGACAEDSHFMATAWCPQRREFFCSTCATGTEIVEGTFAGWEYWFSYRSPWTGDWQPALDRLEFDGRHPGTHPSGGSRTADPAELGPVDRPVAGSAPSAQWPSAGPIGLDQVRAAWNHNAARWDEGYDDDGDETRRYLTDGPLRQMAGDVEGRDVLDLGCGNGYLCRTLARAGARVTGVDLSDRMLAAAARHDQRERSGAVRYLHASATDLSGLDDAAFDLVVSNFVLQDVPDHERALHEAFRVLRPGGRAVLVISHPCFSCGPREWQPRAADSPRPDDALSFAVDHYFHEQPYLLDAWDGFDPVPYFHRSLTSYWRAFREAGFVVDDFAEPELNERGRAELPPGRAAQYDRIPLACVFGLTRPPVP